VVAVKIFVFDSDGGLEEVFGEIVDGDRIAVLVSIDFKKKFAVAV